MALGIIDTSILTAIANAIRAKLGVQTQYKPSQMANAISQISGGGITPTGTKSITANGTYDVSSFANAEVAVPSSGITPTGTKSITENGTYDVTAFASAEVNVAGGSGSAISAVNILDGVTLSQGYITNAGVIKAPDSGKPVYTDEIDVTGHVGDVLRFLVLTRATTGTQWCAICCYDASHAFISRIDGKASQGAAAGVFTLPECQYIRLTWSTLEEAYAIAAYDADLVDSASDDGWTGYTYE